MHHYHRAILYPLLSLALVFFMASPALSLDICGFGDALYIIPQDTTMENYFTLGQFEVDFESSFDDMIVVSAAVAYDAGGALFGLGCFTIDFHLLESEAGLLSSTSPIDHSGIIAGQFDVPFGIDLFVYPSIERKLISGPLVIENTHDFWNDYGIQGYLEKGPISAILFATNGFGYQIADTAGLPLDVPMNMAMGGHLGITPGDLLSIGGSFAAFIDADNSIDMSLIGADVTLTYEDFAAKGEYIMHQMGNAGAHAVTNSGFYAQGLYSFGKYFCVARYGMFTPDDDSLDPLSRVTAGAGWIVREGYELRLEYQMNSEDNDDVAALQAVVGF